MKQKTKIIHLKGVPFDTWLWLKTEAASQETSMTQLILDIFCLAETEEFGEALRQYLLEKRVKDGTLPA